MSVTTKRYLFWVGFFATIGILVGAKNMAPSIEDLLFGSITGAAVGYFIAVVFDLKATRQK